MFRAIASLALVLLVAGCAAETPSAPPPSATEESTARATPTTEPETGGHTLAELAQHPCVLLTPEEQAAAGYTGDGQEQPNDYQELICNWERNGVSIGFTAFSATDVTRSSSVTEATGLVTPTEVSGNPAVQVEYRNACLLYVALGPDGSFRLTAIGSAQETLCPAATEFATLAVARVAPGS